MQSVSHTVSTTEMDRISEQVIENGLDAFRFAHSSQNSNLASVEVSLEPYAFGGLKILADSLGCPRLAGSVWLIEFVCSLLKKAGMCSSRLVEEHEAVHQMLQRIGRLRFVATTSLGSLSASAVLAAAYKGPGAGYVGIQSLWQFACPGKTQPTDELADCESNLTYEHFDGTDSTGEVLKRVRAALGSMDYELMTCNCEHFATWAVSGKPQSSQALNGARVVGAAGTGGALGAAGGAVASATGGTAASGLVAGAFGGGIKNEQDSTALALSKFQATLKRQQTAPAKGRPEELLLGSFFPTQAN